MSLEATTRYYATDNPTAAISDAKRGLYRRMLAAAEQSLGRPGRLLDVGCSRGDFLLAARKRGWRVAGVEPVQALAQQARRAGLEVTTGTLRDLSGGAGPFDLVSWWDVLMLVDDPLREVRRGASLLSGEGLLFARLRQHRMVRALDRLWRITGGPLGRTNPAVYHPWNFEPRTVAALCRRAGVACRVRGSPMTAGDAYRVGRLGLLGSLKRAADLAAGGVERLSGGRWILSPSMELWAWRE